MVERWNEDIDLSEYELCKNGMTVVEGDRSIYSTEITLISSLRFCVFTVQECQNV
ncbi:MAG: hypothetical protein V7L20_15585 [Nostoc sp.]